jgi:3-deoxy-7-phosphoheptulonate synthase
MVAEYADVLQVGARNMQNYSLLERLGAVEKPILLKRGLSATLKEWLMAAEYIVSKGNFQVALCERGIRTFETMTRNTLDINAIPVLKALTHLPVVVDPSHGIGLRPHVPAIARAGIAAGADGLIIEVHPCPEKALSDGHQSLTPAEFEELMRQARVIAGAIGRPFGA